MRYKRSVAFLIAILICVFMAASLFGADSKNPRTYFNLNRAPKFAIPMEYGPVGGVPKGDIPMMSLGMIPTSSPGFQAGLTTYEYQHNGSMGRQIAFHPSNNMVHFVWMAQTDYIIPGNRHIRFQAYDTQDSPPDYTQEASGKRVTEDYSGYVSLDVTNDGRAFFGCHTDPAGDPDHYWTVGYKDYAAGFGIFTDLTYMFPDTAADWYFEDANDLALETIWPQIEVHYGTEECVYLLSHVFEGAEDLILYRKKGTADWDAGRYVETVTDLAYLIVSNQGSDTAAIVYTDDLKDSAEGSGGQTNLDVWYMITEDQFDTWSEPICVTNYTVDSLWRAYSDLAAVFSEPEGTLHILWAARELRSATQFENYKSRLMHWDPNHGPSIISEARYDMGNRCDPDAWNMYIAKMSLATCDGNVYALWTQFGEQGDPLAMIDCSSGGYANGELYFCGSDDDGLTWDLPENLTNSRTPGCDSAECDSDHWSSMVRFGMVYDGFDTLDILYMNDKDAGGIPQGSGSWCVNPVMHLRIPCRTVAHMPKTSYEPNNFVDPMHAAPGVTLDTTLRIINIGNDDMVWTATIEYVDGTDWMTLSSYGGTINPAPAPNSVTLNVSFNYNNSLTEDPSGWDAYIVVTSAAPTSPDSIPIHFTVASDFSLPVGDTLESYVAGPRLDAGKALMVYNTAHLGNNQDYLTLDVPVAAGECDTADQFPNTPVWLFSASPMITWLNGADTNAYTTVFTQLFTEDGTFRPQDDGMEWIDTLPDVNKCRFRVSTSDSVFGVQVALCMPTDGSDDFVVGRNRFMLWDATEAVEDARVGFILDWDTPADSSVDNFSGYLDTTISDISYDGKTAAGHLFITWQRGAEYHIDNDTVPCTIDESNRYGGMVLLNVPSETPEKLTAWSTENTPNQLGSGYDPAFLYNQMRLAATEMYTTDSAIDLHTGITFDSLTIGVSGTEVYTYTFALITTNDGWDDFLAQAKNAYGWAKFNDICVTAGDANNDDGVNVGDAVYMINYVFKSGPAPPNTDQGDPNHDGGLNVGDAVYLINYVFKSGPAPRCGFVNDADLMWK